MIQESAYTLSTHARERLAERSTISPEVLLEHLNAGAYKRLLTEGAPNISESDRAALRNGFGLTDSELKELNVLEYTPLFEHLLVWFNADDPALIAVATCSSRLVVTILDSTQASKKKLQETITEKALSRAQQRTEHLRRLRQSGVAYEFVFRWLDADSCARVKVVSAVNVIEAQPMHLARPLIIAKGREIAKGGYDLSVTVRLRRSPEVVVEEFNVE